jgi:membrane protease YdiL (CAAX protease family)
MLFSDIETTMLRIGGTYGPLLSSLYIVWKTKKIEGIKQLVKPLFLWRVSLWWYLFALFSTAIISLFSIGIYLIIDRNPLQFYDIRTIYLVIPVALYVLVGSVLGEEIGWRGYALPFLQQRFKPLLASTILGLIWGIWHLPLFFIEQNFHTSIPFWIFLIQEVAISIVITWLYNRSKGSLLIIHLFHTASNTTIGVLPILPDRTGGDLLPFYIVCSLLLLFALTLTATGELNRSYRLKGDEDNEL